MLHTIVRSWGPGRTAVVMSVLAGVLFALTQSLAVSPYASADEAAHVDYAYQVWHGELPVFEEGLDLRPEHAFVPPVQWTAQHPPLYYLLLAPLVGPLADAGWPVAAAYAARAVSTLLLALLVLASWWGAREATSPASPVPAATALVVACTAWAARLGGSAYNDILAALLVTLLLGLTLRALRRGLDPRLVAALSAVAAACALARASALVLAVVCLGTALLAQLVRTRPPVLRPALALAVAGPVAVLLTAGWFYLRNWRTTGSITGGHPDWSTEHLGRSTRTFGEAVTDTSTWAQLLDVFQWDGVLPRGAAAVVLLVVPAAAGAVAAVQGLRRRPLPVVAPGQVRGDRTVPPAAFLGAVTAVALTVQVAYTTTNGSAHPRYLLPVVLALGLAVACCLVAWPRVAVTLWTGLVLVDFAVWLSDRVTAAPVDGRYPVLAGPALVVGCAAVVAALVAAFLVVRTARDRAPAA